MITYTSYDDSGRILGSGICSADDLPLQGALVIPGHGNDSTDYVLAGEIVSRPPNPSTVDGLTISNIPVDSDVWIEEDMYTVTDGILELSFEYPGIYPVRIHSFPEVDTELIIENPS